MELQEERWQRLGRETNAIAERIIASGELKGHASIVRLRVDAQKDVYRKHWTTTCFVVSRRISLVHVGPKVESAGDTQPVDLAADELDSALAIKYPVISEGFMANLKRDWWAYKHQMHHICQRKLLSRSQGRTKAQR